MRSSDFPSDSTDASTRESAFLPFSATSEYDCSGRRSDSPSAAQTASGKPDTAFAAANGTAFYSPLPKKRTSHAGAQDRAEARAGQSSARPKPNTTSRTTRQTRSLPKQAETALSLIHALAANGAHRITEHPTNRHQWPKPRRRSTDPSLVTSKALTRENSPVAASPATDPALSHCRGNATSAVVVRFLGNVQHRSDSSSRKVR